MLCLESDYILGDTAKRPSIYTSKHAAALQSPAAFRWIDEVSFSYLHTFRRAGPTNQIIPWQELSRGEVSASFPATIPSRRVKPSSRRSNWRKGRVLASALTPINVVVIVPFAPSFGG